VFDLGVPYRNYTVLFCCGILLESLEGEDAAILLAGRPCGCDEGPVPVPHRYTR